MRKHHFFTSQSVDQFKKLVYWIGLPCLLFADLSRGIVLDKSAIHLLTIYLGGSAGVAVVLFALSKIFNLERWRIGSFMLCGFNGSTAYVGMPVAHFAFSHYHASQSDEASRLAILGLGMSIIFINIVSVSCLLFSSEQTGNLKLSKLPKKLITNPLLIATIAGLAWSLTGIAIPEEIRHSISITGKLVLPVALFCVGAAVVTTKISGDIIWPTISSMGKTIICPAIGLLIIWMLGSASLPVKIGMIMLAVPTSVSSYVLTSELKGDPELASASIVISTFFSLASLAVIVAIT